MRNPLPIIMVLVAAILLTLPAAGQDDARGDRPAVDVYLLAGQSNMQGVGKVAELPPAWRGPVDGAYFWQRDGFRPLDAGSSPLSTRAGIFGPELGFARTMRLLEPGREVYLVKFYRSGQPLHHGWDGGRWLGGAPALGRRNFYPGEADADDAIGAHYSRMITMARAAFAHLREQGYEPVLRGIVWMQGEADAKHETSADEYAESLARLKRRIEEDLASEPVAFVFGQVLAHTPPAARFTDRSLLRTRMAQADMRSGDARAIPGVWMVQTEGMPLNDDTVHYNAEGLKLLGTAFGVAMRQAQHALSEAQDGADR